MARLTARMVNRNPTVGGTNTKNFGKVLHPLQKHYVMQRLHSWAETNKREDWLRELQQYAVAPLPIKVVKKWAKLLDVHYHYLVPDLVCKRVTTDYHKIFIDAVGYTPGYNTAKVSELWLKKYWNNH